MRVGSTRFLTGLAIMLPGAAGAACADTMRHDRDGEQARSPMTVEEALETHTPALMALSGVTGTAQGLCEGQPCVKVFVIEKTSEPPSIRPEPGPPASLTDPASAAGQCGRLTAGGQ